MRRVPLPTIFNLWHRKPVVSFLPIANLNGTVNTTSLDHDIADHELSYAQNLKRGSGTTLETRDGIDTYGQYLGNTTGILGGFSFRDIAGNEEHLVVYDTGVYRDVSQTWTPLTSVTMTTNKQADGVFFPFTNKFYITNKTDNVVKYTAGASAGDQTDAAFKKGQYLETFYNRLLVANVASAENRVWYTDNQLDTFSSNNYFDVDGTVIGMERLSDKLLIFTNEKVYRLYGFTFDGTTGYASHLDPLPTDFGAIIDRTIKKVGNVVIFLGLDARRKAAMYATDGYRVWPLSETNIGHTFDQVSDALLINACAAADATLYQLFITPTGQSRNNLGIIYDSVRQQFNPFTTRYVDNVAAPSVAWNISQTGVKKILIGSQTEGQIYLINSNSSGYDMLPEESQLTLTAAGRDISSASSTRAGESFKLQNYNNTQTLKVNRLSVSMKYVSGTAAPLQMVVRSGSQTGTIVGTSDTLSAFSVATQTWKDFAFSTPLSLTGATSYYYQVKHVTEGSGNSVYNVGTNTAGGYTAGQLYTYASGTWSAVSGEDIAFRVYVQSIIDWYLDSKAFHPAGVGFQYKAHKFQVFYGTGSTAGIEVGFSKDGQSSFLTQSVSAASSSGAITWAGGATWGGGSLWGGAQTRQYQWFSLENLQGHTLKARVRGRQPNTTAWFESLVVAYNAKLRQQ